MGKDNCPDTENITNNLSLDNPENTNVKKSIDESDITIISSTINKSRIVSGNNVHTTTDNDHQSTVAPPNDYHTSTYGASQ